MLTCRGGDGGVGDVEFDGEEALDDVAVGAAVLGDGAGGE